MFVLYRLCVHVFHTPSKFALASVIYHVIGYAHNGHAQFREVLCYAHTCGAGA